MPLIYIIIKSSPRAQWHENKLIFQHLVREPQVVKAKYRQKKINLIGRKLKKNNKTQKNPPGLVFFKTRIFANPDWDPWRKSNFSPGYFLKREIDDYLCLALEIFTDDLAKWHVT
jgi:hypothetical protein